MDLNLKGKRAFVGGSSRGIGLAAAIELSKLGAEVVLCGRHVDALAQAVSLLDEGQGQHHEFLVADFSDPDEVYRKALIVAGERPVHILVNNTGGPPAGPLVEADTAHFYQALRNHLFCNHLLMQAFVPGMKVTGYGRIINIISTSVKQPIDGLGVSNTVRGAVANWAKTLANELGPFGITVNNVLPGATMTSRLEEIARVRAQAARTTVDEVFEHWKAEIPLRRIGQPEEVGAAVAFLATPAAAYINGINLPVDGGRTRCL
ncbi:MAG: short-chain dehydrogenase [Saprospiraceae bacterium]|nr:MAG: short-chain dehydrogenase [Saprospiraceae bacterium]